jgi:hypothetical protein
MLPGFSFALGPGKSLGSSSLRVTTNSSLQFFLDNAYRIAYTLIHIKLCASGRQLPLFCCPHTVFIG